MTPIFPYQPGYASDWAGRPQRLVIEERWLWQWWRKRYGHAFDEFWFDQPMDGVQPMDKVFTSAMQFLDPTYQRVYYAVNAKRADVIARVGEFYTIIELRKDIGPQTLGEVKMYDELARLEWPQLHWTPAIVVGRVVDQTLRKVFDQEGIRVFLSSEDESQGELQA